MQSKHPDTLQMQSLLYKACSVEQCDSLVYRTIGDSKQLPAFLSAVLLGESKEQQQEQQQQQPQQPRRWQQREKPWDKWGMQEQRQQKERQERQRREREDQQKQQRAQRRMQRMLVQEGLEQPGAAQQLPPAASPPAGSRKRKQQQPVRVPQLQAGTCAESGPGVGAEQQAEAAAEVQQEHVDQEALALADPEVEQRQHGEGSLPPTQPASPAGSGGAGAAAAAALPPTARQLQAPPAAQELHLAAAALGSDAPAAGRLQRREKQQQLGGAGEASPGPGEPRRAMGQHPGLHRSRHPLPLHRSCGPAQRRLH